MKPAAISPWKTRNATTRAGSGSVIGDDSGPAARGGSALVARFSQPPPDLTAGRIPLHEKRVDRGHVEERLHAELREVAVHHGGLSVRVHEVELEAAFEPACGCGHVRGLLREDTFLR